MATQIFKYISNFLDKVIVPDAVEDNEAVNLGQLNDAVIAVDLNTALENGNTSEVPLTIQSSLVTHGDVTIGGENEDIGVQFNIVNNPPDIATLNLRAIKEGFSPSISFVKNANLRMTGDENEYIAYESYVDSRRLIIDLDSFTLPAMTAPPDQNSFAPISIKSVATPTSGWIDYEITWSDSGVSYKLSAIGDYNIQLLTTGGGLQISGQTRSESTYVVNSLSNTPKIVFYY